MTRSGERRNPATPTSDPVELIAAILAGSPGAVAEHLATHVDDGTAHCRGCPIGAQAGYHRFPCTMRSAAERALLIQAGR